MVSFVYTSATLVFLLHYVAAVTAAVLPIEGDDATRRLQTPSDGDLRFNEATFITSHNAHANLALAGGDPLLPLGANQEYPIYNQLAESGVRGLMIDLSLDEDQDEPLRLTHGTGFLTLDYGGARSELGTNLVPFLEQNSNAIISFFLETGGDTGSNGADIRAAILDQLKNIFSVMTVAGETLKEMTFKYNDPRWQSHSDWPTLDEIRSSNQRIFVFTDRSDMADQEFGFMYNRDVLQENNFDGIEVCENRYGFDKGPITLPFNDYWSRLVLMNHFSGYSGPDSRGDTVGENLIGGGTNGWGILYRRVLDCMSANGGFKPNFIALDWVIQSEEARAVADYLRFGGRLGTGQTCSDDSHCATSSCNRNAGLCQCQQCPPNSGDVCLGCESGEYCAVRGAGMNICQPNSVNSVSGFQPNMNKPTFDSLNRFYCGNNFTQAYGDCYANTPCPSSAPEECPNGDTCYGGIVCIAPPTLSPTSSLQPTAGATSPKPTVGPTSEPTVSPIGSGLGNTIAEGGTSSPTATILEGQFYCGANYTDAAENCAEAVKCPGGNDECPMGEICYFLRGIVCPTPAPSDSPSTSSRPSPKPIVGVVIGGVPAIAPTPMLPENTLCGTNADETEANCKNAFPCSSAPDCAFLGIEFSCFSVECNDDAMPTVNGMTNPPTPPPMFGVVTPPVITPTPPTPISIGAPTPPAPSSGGGLLGGLGLTAKPTSVLATLPETNELSPSFPTTSPSSSPSSKPTEVPFDFDNIFFCGADYDDARENCYRVNKPCPTQAPESCPGVQQCYGGVTCTIPPSLSPTTSPTPAPTKAATTPGGAPGDGEQPGGRPNNMPAPNTEFETTQPFDDSAWGPYPTGNSAANIFMTGILFWGGMFAFGFTVLLV